MFGVYGVEVYIAGYRDTQGGCIPHHPYGVICKVFIFLAIARKMKKKKKLPLRTGQAFGRCARWLGSSFHLMAANGAACPCGAVQVQPILGSMSGVG